MPAEEASSQAYGGSRWRPPPSRRHIPLARTIDRAQLDDHTATFLTDIGLSLVALDEGGGEPALMRDGTEIQRLIADRHGAQRARLGWAEDHLSREFKVLREEVASALQREIAANASGANLDDSLGVVHRLLEQAERVSRRGWSSARSAEAESGPAH